MTFQIIYSSFSAAPMEREDLEELLEHAQGSNSSCGVTGALVYADRFFLQILEGEKETVENLFERISGDVRHETVTLLQAGEIPHAAFSDWEMAYVSATPEQMAKWAGLNATTRLPDVMTNMAQDPQRAAQVAASILSVLAAESASQRTSE